MFRRSLSLPQCVPGLQCASALLLLASFAVFTPSAVVTQAAANVRAADCPLYPPPSYSMTIPFAEAVDFSRLDHTLKLLTSINGGPAGPFTVDTGSVGVVVPASEVPNIDPKAPPGFVRYSSSGLRLDGVWTRATVRFLNPDNQAAFIEAAVEVLAVSRASCGSGGPNSGRCTARIPHMLGVGFGRGSGDGMRTAAANPFVNLAPMQAGDMRHGYMITRRGVTFGLTEPETRGFTFVKLEPRKTASAGSSTGDPAAPDSSGTSASSAAPPFGNDWTTAPGYLTIGKQDYAMGGILMDTGLTNFLVAEPGAPDKGTLPAATQVTVHLLGGKLAYGFTTPMLHSPGQVNGTNPLAGVERDDVTSVTPREAVWIHAGHGPFVNTGLRALACFDYLYDADRGFLGLRPTCKP